MSIKTRAAALALAVCMAAALLSVPAGAAAAAGFSDIQDRETAVAVESLRLMGVLDGFSDGTFRPNGTLNRAQFCKMAVYALNGSGELGQYRTVTVFPDVKPSYWAAAYINMAAKGKKIIAGYPDGSFHPDRTVTVGQAVTILMRLLGYQDSDIGGIWPQGYLSTASDVGLTSGLTLSSGAALTRGQAARLFLNLLRTNQKGGTSYASTVASTVKSGVMLVSSSATGDDGNDTAMQTGNGTTYQMANKTSNGLLNGYKGSLLLDKQGKVLTFVPDSLGTSKTVTISKAEATKLTDVSGSQYAISGSVSVYYNNQEKTWSDCYSFLNPGNSVTLYLGASGGVEYVFAGGGSTSKAAVVVYARGSMSGFSSLTGGSTNYALYKDGAAATAADMRPYDVATYSSATNTIRVCDVRITGSYENCSPSTSAPTTVTVLGHSFDVLPSAADTLSAFKLGQQITLLLTEDNQVAGAVEATGNSGATGNAVGIARSVSASSATVDLLCGISVTGSTSLSEADVNSLSGQLVKVSSTQKGFLTLSALTGGAVGDLDTVNRKLGTKSLSDGVMIFEKSSGGVSAISLSKLTSATIPASQILYAGYDWAGRAKLLVVVSTSGGDYIFGRASYMAAHEDVDDEGNPIHVSASLTLQSGSKTYGPFSTAYSVPDGVFIGIRLNGSTIQNLMELGKLGNVPNSAWSGEGSVTVSGRTCTVPDDVLCYNQSSHTWVTLAAAHAFSRTSTLYVDDYGIVRGVVVG